MSPRCYYVYILASKIDGTLYIGITNDLIRRVAQHKLKLIESFTKDYGVVRLVYFEQFDDPENAIRREKRLKKGNRTWKVRLIEQHNPNWDDLYHEIAALHEAVVPREGGASSTPRRV
ncbi:putative endonuclease [Bradyrhizobium shewense]|uniref:Putative endonuclease n=1 Tax=Bradyrhizobium shewense TaxID=1761772 RepID=A0A1C3UZQ9_9BRAD|nr:GIY-YIG nuclease family protein [Bradyrhizobium shewense]SCB20924.1 putative endonuclease [Bradyrhizobium shewense]